MKSLEPLRKYLARFRLPKLAARDKKALGLALSALFVYLFFTQGIKPLLSDYRQVKDQIAVTEITIQRYQDTIAKEAALDRELAGLRQELNHYESRMFKSDRAPIVAAEIQKILQEICDKYQTSIKQTRVIPQTKESTQGSYQEIKININFTTTIWSLKDILYDISTNPKMLTIPEVRFQSLSYGNVNNVDVNLTVAGFVKS
ncbi:MAG: hypothetical protein HQK58_07535 [Deltaproteobacteria bacterium]|nr:hypothetical protein [Deltaproteobacteria bacterium]